MDILNFISWIKGKRQLNVVDPAKTLLPIGIKDGRRDDEYITGAILVEDFITQIGTGTQGPQGIPGPQGPQGNTGPQGIQGNTGAQGTAGNSVTILGSYADLAAFNAGAGSVPGTNIGDAWILLSDGSLYSWNGTNWFDAGDIKGPQGDQGIQGIQGEQGEQGFQGLEGIQGVQGIQGPVGPGVASGGDAGQVLVKVDSVNYNTTWVDASTIGAPVAIRWSPTFQATGLTFTGSGITYPTYNSYYIKFGQMVSFSIVIELSTVTNFGTGQFKAELPFIPIPTASNHFSAWSWVNPALPPDELNGHIQMVADHLPGSQILDLHWLKETTATPKPLIESLLVQGTPITFTIASKMYINGTYIAQN